jgi:DNA-binding transcriptional MocR family regulator
MSRPDTVDTSDTKAEALARRLAAAIDKGTLAPGARLRSIRDCAHKETLSRNTVVEAYNRLVARGYAEPRPGSGTYVRKPADARATAVASHVTEAVDVVSLLREQLEQHHAVRVGDGRPPASWMEASELGRHLRGARRSEVAHLGHGYGTPWGYAPLRETIVRLLHDRLIEADTRQVLLTQGANHALDLIVRQLLQPGDVVLVDAPGYYPLFGKLKLAKVDLVGVPRGPDGPDLDALRRLAALHRPKVFFTQSLAHNPTGGSISLPKAHGLLQVAAQHDFWVVDDDPFADLMPPAAPRLAALDQLQRVLYVSSFSKTLSAGLRVGYIAGPADTVAALCDLKMVTIVSTSDFVERVVCELVASGQYRKHLARLRQRLDEAHRLALRVVGRAALSVQPPDPGGYYLWAPLPRGLSEIELLRQASAKGIFIAPGSVFYPDRQPPYPAMRVNVAYAGDERFQAWLRSLARSEAARVKAVPLPPKAS